VARYDLPPETQRQPLDYRELITTLDTIGGTGVVVKLMRRGLDDGATPGLASMIGELTHQVPARYEGYEFSIGSPYPDRAPSDDHAGGVLFINEDTFESATLTTFDGHDYFAISIETRWIEILIQDEDSGYP